ncbi:hypothetical protein [Paracidobacterium acidisoli]|uniref:TrbI/VirB10 family protein n=1 Tax=Paracidobacterium acidisoli TaxID=2303751 RepID=A0A372IN13_9BACT|nr:hypothetical protein [Paracidobacterium acidisoli]MBT9331923.1 hypothetical protein [Paracidobacterium acidisoli]
MLKKAAGWSVTVAMMAILLAAGCGRHAGHTAASEQPSTPAQSTPASGLPAASPPASTSQPSQPANGQSANSAAPVAAPAGNAPYTPPLQQRDAGQKPSPVAAGVVVPDETELSIRLDQHISVKTSQAGDKFSGTIVHPIVVNGLTAIPAGSQAEGVVLRSHRRGHFKGRSILQLTLTGLDVNGRHYQIDTRSLMRTKKGKGRRTAAFIGGGSGLGMLIGGVATGGVGLVVGGLSGAGAGTLGAAFTGNRDINLPAESIVRFRLSQPIQLQ